MCMLKIHACPLETQLCNGKRAGKLSQLYSTLDVHIHICACPMFTHAHTKHSRATAKGTSTMKLE